MTSILNKLIFDSSLIMYIIEIKYLYKIFDNNFMNRNLSQQQKFCISLEDIGNNNKNNEGLVLIYDG